MSWKVKEGHGGSFPIIVSAPVPVPFFGLFILDLGLGFRTGLGLDNMEKFII